MNIKTIEIRMDVDCRGRLLNKPRSGRTRTKKSFGKKWCRGAFFALAS